MTIIKDIGTLLSSAKDFSTWIAGEKFESLIIDCKNYRGIHSTTILANSISAKLSRSEFPKLKKFDPNQVYDIKVYSIRPHPKRINDAVTRSPSEYILNFNKLLSYDEFRIDIEYLMDVEFIDGLVRRRSSPEPLDDATKFHLSAQLRDSSSLIHGFSEIEIEEYPVTAEVPIQNDISLQIPDNMKKLARIESALLGEMDRGVKKVMGLHQEKIRLMKDRDEEVIKKLIEVQKFLNPTQFLTYLDRKSIGDFRLDSCMPGDLSRFLGLVQLPSKMRVVSRTDLSLDSPAKSGELVYESKKFGEDINTLLK